MVRLRSVGAYLPALALSSCAVLLALPALIGPAQPQGAAVPILQAQADSKLKIAFVGDSMADGLWGGISRLVMPATASKAMSSSAVTARTAPG